MVGKVRKTTYDLPAQHTYGIRQLLDAEGAKEGEFVMGGI